jgi:hypothetical protein
MALLENDDDATSYLDVACLGSGRRRWLPIAGALRLMPPESEPY